MICYPFLLPRAGDRLWEIPASCPDETVEPTGKTHGTRLAPERRDISRLTSGQARQKWVPSSMAEGRGFLVRGKKGIIPMEIGL
jgi:hypothetical protein